MRISMEAAFYFYTIVVMFLCIAAAVSSASSYLVTHNHLYLPIVMFFFLYFVDLMFIFQNEYFNRGEVLTQQMFYGINYPFAKTLLAAGILESLWLTVCAYIGTTKLALKVIPAVVFVATGCAIIVLMPEGAWRQWCFYSIREAFLIWVLAYTLARYLRAQKLSFRTRLLRHRALFVATAVLCLCITVENTIMILMWNPSDQIMPSVAVLYISERNFSENILIAAFALLALRHGLDLLRLRRTNPPHADQPDYEQHIELILDSYCEKHRITNRERDVLRLILMEKDYQNVATELQLAVGTVKSHTHNILQKTEQKTRKDLIRDVWQS